jgi:hypothetical protein
MIVKLYITIRCVSNPFFYETNKNENENENENETNKNKTK